jgi:hypothetical protein
MAGEKFLPFNNERIDLKQKLKGRVKVFNGPTTKVLREEETLKPNKEDLIERLSELKKELETLRSFGINVVNPDIIVGKYPDSPDNTGFVFTDFIEGLSLHEIHSKPDDSFDEKLVQLCENFSRYYKSKSENRDGIIFTDFRSAQFVYGKNKGDEENKFWFVDIGTDGFLDSRVYKNMVYCQNLIIIIYRKIDKFFDNFKLAMSSEITNNFRQAYLNFGGTEKMFNAKI